jgi:hypothetical protein
VKKCARGMEFNWLDHTWRRWPARFLSLYDMCHLMFSVVIAGR